MGIIERALAAEVAKLGLGTDSAGSALTMAGLITKIAGWVSGIAGVVAFFYLVYSGFIYLTAGGNADAAKKGSQGILNAIIGLAIIAIAWGVVNGAINLIGAGTQ